MSGTQAQPHLTLRGTFIDIEEPEVNLSPRAQSDPGPARRHDFFEDQQRYIEQLDEIYNYDSRATHEVAMLGIASDCGDSAMRSNYSLHAAAPRAKERGPVQAHGLSPDKTPTARGSALPSCREEGSDESPGLRPVSGEASPNQGHGVNVAPITNFEGRWRVVEDGVAEEGVWTIEENGRAFFNGKHFGSDYDIFVHYDEDGQALVQRGDGWTVDPDSAGPDCLVWRKPGQPQTITWARTVSTGSEEAPADPDTQDSKTVLRSKMQASAQQMRQSYSCEGRLSNAIAVMEDGVFRRICEDMQRAASFIIDNMQAEVLAMSKQIRNTDLVGAPDNGSGDGRAAAATAEKVIKNLEVIPTMVQNLLEARIARARERVRRYVQGMIQEMSRHPRDQSQLVEAMQKIPREVVEMAGDSMSAAAQECQAHASKQLEVALSVLQEQEQAHRGALVHLKDRHQSAWAHIQGESPAQTCLAWEVGHDPWRLSRTVAQAVALVRDQDDIPQSITNQVVADELLRARIRGGGADNKRTISGAQSRAGGVPPDVQNPGSRGHPDLCRPCLFNAQGTCTKNDGCAFCHAPHPKRPVRFDKLHRETLKRMPFGQLAGIMLPVLKQKSEELELNVEVSELLSSLWPHLQGEAHSFSKAPREVPEGDLTGSEARSHRKEGSFASVLQVMALRSLLATLASKVPDDHPEIRDLAESALQHLHGQRLGTTPGGANSAHGGEPRRGGRDPLRRAGSGTIASL